MSHQGRTLPILCGCVPALRTRHCAAGLTDSGGMSLDGAQGNSLSLLHDTQGPSCDGAHSAAGGCSHLQASSLPCQGDGAQLGQAAGARRAASPWGLASSPRGGHV